ncbi:CSN8-PSD8-EIF3K domain-containing protein [Mycena chlorophos]|uniref:CSN8-PSD8-EIF3K domain-containing protein n=1 Tax=Mycena chlorophos TaxID=658473 RepID=A0A8H6WPJ1_MYCCL|nr:CSN8-PSD8-EIF3K domain-containing protein [Mycena chlorophos]
MSAGPPTPPPSSATEIKDAARTVVPPTASSSAPAPPSGAQDNYTQFFPILASLAAEKKYKELARAAEQGDWGADSPTRLLVTTPLVVAYLILDDLQPARFALLRLPRDLTGTPIAKGLFALLASTSERKYTNIYSRAAELLALTSAPDFDGNLGAVLGLLLNAFLDSFRMRTFSLIQKAYTSIPLPLAQTYLGSSPEEVLNAASNAGWSYDASTQVLTPVAPSASGRAASSFTPFSTLATFDFVASSVARLET